MNILWYIPRGLLSHIQYIHHTCYKVNRKPACFTSSRCCHVRAREETEPNRERSDSRQPPQRREEKKKKKGLHSRTRDFNIPPPPSSRSPLSRVVCTVTVFVLPSLAKIPSLASYLTTTHRIVFDTLDTQTTLISMLSASLPLSLCLFLSRSRGP